MHQKRHGNTLQIKLDNWLFNNDFNENALEIFGKVYVLFAIFIYGIGETYGNSFVKLAQAPDIFFNPPLSIAQLFTGFPDIVTAWGLDILLHVLFGLAFFSIKPSLVYCLIFLLLYLANSLGMSFGKVNHNFVSLILPLILSLGYFLKAKSPSHIGFTKSIYAFLIGFAFFTAGLPKLFAGDWVAIWQHSVKNYAVNFAIFDNPLSKVLGFNNFIFNVSDMFWEFLDYFTLGFELLFLPAAFKHKHFHYFLLLASVFHLGTYFFLEIGFFHHFLCYLFFINWRNFPKLYSAFEKLNNLGIKQKLFFAFLFVPLGLIPNSLFYGLESLENELIRNLGALTFSLFFVAIFAMNIRSYLVNDFKKIKFELTGLWFRNE